MEIRQFRYGRDNLGYVLFSGSEAMSVDGGAAQAILDFLKEKGLTLKYAALTHNHPDHTVGTRNLVEATGARRLDAAALKNEPEFPLGDETVKVIFTPGHTADSVCYYAPPFLVTGDTLFNGTVGNCFSGDLRSFYHSIKKILALPPETLVYAGHDYVEESLVFAETLEPDNPEIAAARGRYDPYHVVSTLKEEALVNPYLRFNEEIIVKILRDKGLPVENEFDRWHSLMQLG